jgi:hypothetical protein
MAKEKKTAKELAALIAEKINAGGAFVQVHADPVYGWHPTVFTTPGQAIDLQQRAELAAKELRGLFDLKDKD